MLFCRKNATTGEGWLKNINQRAINSAQGVDFGVWVVSLQMSIATRDEALPGIMLSALGAIAFL